MLEWLNLDRDHERIYRALLAAPHLTMDQLADRVELEVDEVQHRLTALVDAELVGMSATDGVFDLAPPQAVLAARIRDEEAALERRQEELKDARDDIGVLVDDFVIGSQTSGSEDMEVLRTADLVRARLYQLSQVVEREVRTVLPDKEIPAEALAASMPLDLDALSRGIIVRSICSPTFLASPGAMEHFAQSAAAGARVRVHPGPPTRMVLVDDTYALVPVDPQDPSQGAYLLKNAALTAPLATLFQEIWAASVPFHTANSETGEPDDSGLDERVRIAVVMLAQGQKDAAVARRMGVSTRTVRRWLALAMQTLGTDSRFELAVEVTRRGWLPSAADGSDAAGPGRSRDSATE